MPLICEKKPPPERSPAAAPLVPLGSSTIEILPSPCEGLSAKVHAARTRPSVRRSTGRNRWGRWMDRFGPAREKRRQAQRFAHETVSDASGGTHRNYARSSLRRDVG